MEFFWRRVVGLLLILGMGLVVVSGPDTRACSCAWQGPFKDVVPLAQAVVLGRVERHLLDADQVVAMDFQVEDVLRGDIPNRRIRVWGDMGWLCRASIRQFPEGTHWILALNGPGSKPGQNPGDFAVSSCGQYWLAVAEGMAMGNFNDRMNGQASQSVSIETVRRAALRAEPEVRENVELSGEVRAGEPWEAGFDGGLRFRLEPSSYGWWITVLDDRGSEDLSRLTPPLHFSPNPREIEGWHFRNIDNTGPNEPGEKNVNAPGLERGFIFSPEVGRSIAGPDSRQALTEEDIGQVGEFGQGRLEILEFRLGDLEPGKQARFEWMRFRVTLSWLRGGR